MKKRIILFESDDVDLPTQLIAFLEFFQKQLDKIPEEYRDRSQIEFFKSIYSDEFNLTISYFREETEVEGKLREDAEKQVTSEKEKTERILLRELVLKYADTEIQTKMYGGKKFTGE